MSEKEMVNRKDLADNIRRTCAELRQAIAKGQEAGLIVEVEVNPTYTMSSLQPKLNLAVRISVEV
jgi:hypothetical protein